MNKNVSYLVKIAGVISVIGDTCVWGHRNISPSTLNSTLVQPLCLGYCAQGWEGWPNHTTTVIALKHPKSTALL